MADRFISAVESLFRMLPSDAKELSDELFKRNRQVFEAVVNAQLEAMGTEGGFRLTNGKVLKQLRAEANRSAKQVAATYNRDLAGRVDSVVAAERTRGLNRQTLARRLSDWDTARSPWKSQQIARTEAVNVANIATELFVQASGLETEVRYRLTPGDSDHTDENDLAAASGELVTSAELEAFQLPAHPNERHSPVIAFPRDVDRSALWMGA